MLPHILSTNKGVCAHFFAKTKTFFSLEKVAAPLEKKWPRPPRKKGAAAARQNRCFSRGFHHDLRCFDLDGMGEHLPGAKKLHWSAWACSQLPQVDVSAYFFPYFGPGRRLAAPRRPFSVGPTKVGKKPLRTILKWYFDGPKVV